ncbi:MAG: PAS domain S-box protein [Prolixibacteraceae bacterium]|nr:PAS domain S-box protein [Prolixibacteraceae bacterium]
MKIFNFIHQHKKLNLVFLLYILFSLAYTGIPLFNLFDQTFQGLHSLYLIFMLISASIWLFRNRLTLSFKALLVTLLLIATGFVEAWFTNNNLSYIFALLGILIGTFIFTRIQVFAIMAFAIVGLSGIGILKNLGLINNYAHNQLIHTSWPEFIERILLFSLISGFIIWSLTGFKKIITDFMHANEQEKIKYKPLFDQTYSFISLLDNRGYVIESNEAALYYIQSKPGDVQNKYYPDTPWWKHSEKARNEVIKNLEAAMNGDFRRFELTHVNADGDTEFFDYNLKPIFDDKVGVQFIIAEGRNITEIKKAKQALIEGEERLLALTESTYEGLIISNAGNIVEANKAAVKLFRLKNPNELIGHHFIQEFIHPDEQSMVLEKINDNFTRPFETRAIRSDGTTIPIEIEGRDIIYKGKLHRISAIRDLTERRLAQKALINSEEKYRLITENINDIICKLDEKLNFTYTSSSVYNMLGYTINEMEHIAIKELTTRETYHKIISQLNAKKRLIHNNVNDVWSSVSFEAVLKHKSGKLLWTHINAKLIRWGKNNSFEILCVARNIDALKKIQISLQENEARLKLQNEEYERLNAELTQLNDKLLNAKQKAEESDKLKSAFLANMSHEIRTPMNSIIGFSRMYKSRDIDEEKRNKYADFVVNNGKILLNIVNDVLDLSKIESGQIQLKKESFSLNEFIEELHQRLYNQNQKGLMLVRQKELSDEQSYINADRNRLMQILWNLLNNAYKFTRKGAVKFGYNLVNNNLLFYVEDTGIGIPPEQQDKIFERFRQAEMEASRMFGGAGLGLSISKKMVELMKGKIWLKSQPGIGSTFYVSIPYEKTGKRMISQGHGMAKKQPVQVLPDNITILIAEDDESNFYYLNELLSGYGYTIIRARNGVEAIDICRTNKLINMVFMDIKMPVLDGFEATRAIKQFLPTLPIIAQTAFAMADDKETALAKGCDDYLSKPIDPELLFSKIKKFALK